jgi:TM2 domain-containing membrane protein YozV
VKRSTKAALLSGLVFPGVGHIYLKRHVHGILLSVVAAYAIYFIISVVVSTALEVTEKIQSGDVLLDMGTITDMVSQQSSGAEQTANVAMIVLLACWVIGIVDSYRQGRADEKAAGEKET